MKKALVLGYFGFEDNQLDGQTLKTRSNYSLLKSKEGVYFDNVSFFDTQSFQKSKFNLLNSFKAISKTDILYYVPGRHNLEYIFPFIYLLCKLYKIDLHLIVVGGWLDVFLKNKPIHKHMLSKIKGIYPQTHNLSESLNKIYNYDNVFHLHNFRITDFKKEYVENKELNKRVKLVFMGRVHPEKGVKTFFKLEEELHKKNITNVDIDLYGPMYSNFEKEFNNLMRKSNVIRYKGILNPNDIYITLENYDLMLFPTQCFTEGFPGSILDSYISGVPVIATNWKFASEFITQGKSGIIVEYGNEEAFINETIELIINKNKLHQLQEKVSEEQFKYRPERAWDILKNNL